MPTAEAHYLLGMMDKDNGDMNSAVEHFKVASESQSESGKQATRELVSLDLSANPSRYIGSRAAVDQDNRVWVQFGNLTNVAMKNIEISYAWLDTKGQTREGRKTYSGPLQAGAQDQLQLGIQLQNAGELNNRVRVEITAASLAE